MDVRKAIGPIIEEALKETKSILTRSLTAYFPAPRTRSNSQLSHGDIRERNVSVHFTRAVAAAFGGDSFEYFEVPYFKATRRKARPDGKPKAALKRSLDACSLDACVIGHWGLSKKMKGPTIVCIEAKRVYSSSDLTRVATDIRRLRKFRLDLESWGGENLKNASYVGVALLWVWPTPSQRSAKEKSSTKSATDEGKRFSVSSIPEDFDKMEAKGKGYEALMKSLDGIEGVRVEKEELDKLPEEWFARGCGIVAIHFPIVVP